MHRLKRALLPLLLLSVVSACFAQWNDRRRRRPSSLDEYRQDRNIPNWTNVDGFQHDTFTFARVRYDSYWGGGAWGGGGWAVDYPDSDLNFSLRLQQLTSMKVNPDPVIVRLSDEEIFDYPFLYMIEPGGIQLYEDEVQGLRRFCDNGGFLMVDDFWGDREYAVFHNEIKRVFPDRDVEELDLSHEIFHNVYELKEKPQIPSIRWAWDGNTWEVSKGPSAREVHYRAIKDDDGRIMVLICHNTDLGDGWEREAENREYFEQFSVKKAYPMGINIVTYAMTH
jgi:hypothetical protein